MRVMHTPQHQNTNIRENAVAIRRNYRPLIAGFTEQDWGTYDSIATLRKAMPNYRILAERLGGRSREVPVAFRKRSRYALESVEVIRLHGEADSSKWSHDRYMTVVRYRHRIKRNKKFFHVQTHWDAVIQGPDGSLRANARGNATKAASQKMVWILSKLINEEHRQGTVSGDFNYRRAENSAEWSGAPENIFKTFHMVGIYVGVDALFWTQKLKGSNKKIIPWKGSEINDSDHPWLSVDLAY